MNAWENFKDVVTNKYADFDGRARRREYWYFYLVQGILGFVISMIAGMFASGSEFSLPMLLPIAFSLAMFIPSLAAVVRRLHDTGRSGWMLLICLIPLFGALFILYWLVCDSQYGNNEYGPNPKGEGTKDDHLFDDLGK